MQVSPSLSHTKCWKEPKYICMSLWDKGSVENNYTMLLFEKGYPKNCVLPIQWCMHLAWHDQNWSFLFYHKQQIDSCIMIGGSNLAVWRHDARQMGCRGKTQSFIDLFLMYVIQLFSFRLKQPYNLSEILLDTLAM